MTMNDFVLAGSTEFEISSISLSRLCFVWDQILTSVPLVLLTTALSVINPNAAGGNFANTK